MKVMGIDLGKARTGVCVSDLSGFLAGRSITVTEHNRARLIEAILAEIRAEKPERIVVGLPLNMNGTEGFKAQECREFASQLEQSACIETVLWDERGSSVTANRILSDAGKKRGKQRARVDAVAAQIILQSYLDWLNLHPEAKTPKKIERKGEETMNFQELVKERYSVRKFAERPVEEEKLQKVLEAGACAPTAKNMQPQRIYVLKSPEAIEKIRGLTRCAFNAPVVLLVAGAPKEGWVNPFNDRPSTEMDCSIVTTQMMLAAKELGLGSTWVCWFDTEGAKKLFDLPEDQEVYALLPLGYPADDAHPSSMHGSRKSLEETVKYL